MLLLTYFLVGKCETAGKRNKEMGITGEDRKEDASDLQHALNEK